MFKGNKAPVSEKGAKKVEINVDAQNYDDFYGNRFIIPKAIQEELDEKKLDCRFINYKKYMEDGYYHRSHWQPYRPSKETVAKLSIDSFGKDQDGYIRRGDTVLAYRPKSVSAQHRAFLDKRNARYKAYNKIAAQDLKAKAREAGVDVRIVEGYEDDK